MYWMCGEFDYQLLGLSAHQLRLKLHRVTEAEENGYPADYSGDTVLINGTREAGGGWQTAQLLYTFPGQHTLVFEAIPCPSRNAPTCSSEYRGHIALDSVRLSEQGCLGHCTFEGGPCGWSQDERGDDFQWLLGRSSPSETTGPRADHGSEVFGGTSGGYMYVDSGRSRRPGDRARLLSPQLPATAEGRPLCFRFWIHMFGPGVGTLRVLLLADDDGGGGGGGDGEPRELWHLSSDSGRQWHQSRVTVSSAVPFRLALEAKIGMEPYGDIAVDDVSLTEGICPVDPQVAADWTSGCTFQVDLCGWSGDLSRRGAWERVEAATAALGALPYGDHTTGRPDGGLVRLVPEDPPPPDHRARLVSPVLRRPAGTTLCLTFRYYMDQGVVRGSGSRLGGLRVWAEPTDTDSGRRPRLLWHLINAQKPQWLLARAPIEDASYIRVVLEGMWAGAGGRKSIIAVDDIVLLEGTCEQSPPQSRPNPGACQFTYDSCGWQNTTSDRESQQRWRAAAPLSSLAPRILLTDHTFRAATGYIYFDLYSSQSLQEQLRLISPLLEPPAGDGAGRVCISFWFAHLSPLERTQLRVLVEAVTAGGGDEAQFAPPSVLWSLRASDTGVRRMTWRYAQAGFEATQRHRVTFEGVGSRFGFALDDIDFTIGDCEVRPSGAAPSAEDRPRRSLHP